jgi:hypothetical protein
MLEKETWKYDYIQQKEKTHERKSIKKSNKEVIHKKALSYVIFFGAHINNSEMMQINNSASLVFSGNLISSYHFR